MNVAARGPYDIDERQGQMHCDNVTVSVRCQVCASTEQSLCASEMLAMLSRSHKSDTLVMQPATVATTDIFAVYSAN
eukprot:IDg15637t1